MATNSSILAWRTPWTEDTVQGVLKELDTTERLTLSLSLIPTLYGIRKRSNLPKSHTPVGSRAQGPCA